MADDAKSPRLRKRGLWQWFWRGAELAETHRLLTELPRRQRDVLRHARTALELGDVAFDPIDPLRSGPSLPLSLSLYREAAYWALIAHQPSSTASTLEEAMANVPPEVLTFAAGSPEALEHVRDVLVRKTFRETATDHPDTQRVESRLLRAFVAALIDRLLGPERQLGRLRVQRVVRLGLGVVLVLGSLLGGINLYSVFSRGPDLASGIPLRTSSTNAGVEIEPRNYLFHTQDEEGPWVEIDLKQPQEFSAVDVINRRDCCQDRVLPAVIEVSKNGTRWKEVSRRTESFSTWHAKFAPQTARYVRVRVARRSVLHLAGIAVRAH
ncbi:MAG TPA: discoidin domain-containing protein [Polyangiaceae bacterium]|nr:discoidin domain-containing protein [Polyangiaceae bacterium]